MKKLPVCNLSVKAGLCNRLKGLVSFIRQYQPEEMVLIWPKTLVKKSFSELFSFNYPITIHEKEEPINDMPEQSWRFYVSESDHISKNFSKIPLDRDEPVFDLEYNRTPTRMIEAYLPYFQKLKPNKKIQKIIDSVQLPENTVALHIRNSSDWKDGGRNTSLEEFKKCMDKYPKNTVFFLSVHDKKISDYFKKLYKIIEIPNKDYSSIEYAVADLYLLSKCKKGIYSCGSTFSEVSWWLGGCKAEAHIVGSYEEWLEVAPEKKFFRIESTKRRIKIYLGKFKILSIKRPAQK